MPPASHSSSPLLRASRVRVVVLLAFTIAGTNAFAEAPKPPRITDPSVKLTLFASDPDVVTPIGATVDARGRLLIVESHSHFRPKDYKGPATDRIRILEDTDGDGKADRFTTWYEGENFLMNLAADPDGSVLVSSRNEIFRLTDAGDHATGRTTIARLETSANYPHNGLHGLAIDKNRNVY